MKRLLPLLLALLLMGADDCSAPPEPGGYCGATDDTFNIMLNLEGGYSTIVGGTPSVDRRSTFFLYMPTKGSCTAVMIGPRTLLSAAHCQNTSSDGRHLAQLDRGDAGYWTASSVLIHPRYQDYLSSGNQDAEGRKSDLMLLYFDEDLPAPTEDGFVTGPYVPSSVTVPLCSEMTIQGFGQTEEDPKHPCPVDAADTGLAGAKCLREGPTTVTREDDLQLFTKHAVIDPVAICFGDSGGPGYVKLKGQPGYKLAGITSTTYTLECRYASMHTKVAAPLHANWIADNFSGPGNANNSGHWRP